MSISVGMAMMMLGSKKITKEELDEVIKQHFLWLEDSKTGKRAVLKGYDLSEMDFNGLNLSEANFTGCLLGDEKEYFVGDTVESDEFDNSLLHDGAGIIIRMSRKDAERIEYKTEDVSAEKGAEEKENE